MKTFIDIVEEIKSIVSSEFNSKKIFDKDVADILGISQMNFATMKKRNKIPFTELLDFCAKKSLSINWMLYGQSPESLVEATNKFYMVKYFSDVNASAGGGENINQCEEIEELEIPEQFVFMLGGERELKNIEAINVSGDSMEPTFSYNDIVFINRSKTDLNRGGIFTVRTQAGLFIKRIQKRIDGKIDIISDNQVYSTQTLDASEIDVIGRVVSRFGDVD
jgi:phage repressor protein C with HTH and peptisase S24 domain